MRKEAHRKRDYPAHRASLLKLVVGLPAVRVAEVGVYRSLTAKYILEAGAPQLELYLMVDPWVPYGGENNEGGCPEGNVPWEKHYQTALDLQSRYACAKVLRKPSVEAAATIREPFDIVFIDGDHSYEAVRQDIAAWRPLVRAGGLLVGHDYYTKWPGVVRAVDEAFQAEDLRFLPDTVWYVQC